MLLYWFENNSFFAISWSNSLKSVFWHYLLNTKPFFQLVWKQVDQWGWLGTFSLLLLIIQLTWSYPLFFVIPDSYKYHWDKWLLLETNVIVLGDIILNNGRTKSMHDNDIKRKQYWNYIWTKYVQWCYNPRNVTTTNLSAVV